MTKFKIDDVVWKAQAGKQEVINKCPICDGKKKVILILGNNDSVKLPCDYCGEGYTQPTGIEKSWEYVAEPAMYIIDKVIEEETNEGKSVEYRSGLYILYHNEIFRTKEEAMEMSQEKARKHFEEQKTRSAYIKKDVNKSFSWNAGYHIRNAKDLEKRIEYHKKMAVICKSKERNRA